jgi:hypothetical protein
MNGGMTDVKGTLDGGQRHFGVIQGDRQHHAALRLAISGSIS